MGYTLQTRILPCRKNPERPARFGLRPKAPTSLPSNKTFPRGSKDPNNRVLGPKYYTINGIWALKPYYLGPWTFRVLKKTVSTLNPKPAACRYCMPCMKRGAKPQRSRRCVNSAYVILRTSVDNDPEQGQARARPLSYSRIRLKESSTRGYGGD